MIEEKVKPAKGAQIVRWMQLNAPDPETRIVIVNLPSNQKRLVLTAAGDLASWQLDVLDRMGFKRSRSGFLMNENLRLRLRELRKVYPKALPVDIEISEIYRVLPKAADDPLAQPQGLDEAVALKRAVLTALPLGLNAGGEMVYLGEDGRFINGHSKVVQDAVAGAEYLYASSDEDLAKCADGFVLEIASGKICRFDDLRRFASIVTEIPEEDVLHTPRMREVQEAVEAALVRYLGHRMSAKEDEIQWQDYRLALLLEEGQPPMAARTSESIALQQYSTPLPMSLAVQRIFGDVKGKTVLEPTIGNASLVCGLGDAKVVGVELDERRLGNARRNCPDGTIEHGDATTVDFKSANGGKAYDLVVSNPPFGGLKTAQTIQGLKVTRLDHLILMRSLLARSDDGIGVYIIGADSYLDSRAGQVNGGSRYLFNWLADHYHVSVAEVDGGLFAKQGATFPIRVVVVGKKGPGGAPVPDTLPVIYDHKELFEWTGQMQAKYALSAVVAEEPSSVVKIPYSVSDPIVSDDGMSRTRTKQKAPANRPDAGEKSQVPPQVDEVVDSVPQGADESQSDRVPSGHEGRAKPSISPEGENVGDLEENSYQSPYSAASRVGEATAMIPRNLATPTRQALADVAQEYGEVDEFVAGELGWTTDEMGDYLSPEQVDAVALAIHGVRSGRSFLEADQTGLGKGRVMAALARFSALNGRTVIFLTETPTLFTDFWRDVRDIGSEDLFSPMIVNDGVAVYDPISGNRLIPATPKSVIESSLRNNQIDPAFNLVLGTYSQFNRDRAASAKSRWITEVAAGSALLLDEAHNAAGDSNTGRNIGLAIELAGSVIYSSATSMKGAKNVMLYSKLFPSSVDMGALPETLATGGEVLQEVLSGMLAKDGVFVRREHDLSNLTFRTVTDTEREERNRFISDKLASILEYMNFLAGDINELVNERNKDIRKMLEKIPDDERKGNRMGAVSVNFGSRLFAIYRQFMMAIKTDLAAERAIKALQEGKKPVIVLENTMESLLNEVVMRNEPDLMNPDDLGNAAATAAALQGEVILEEVPTFRDVLHRMLDRLGYYCETSRYGEVVKVPVDSEGALETIQLVRSLINEFPDLPVSPLDDIRNRVEEAGFRCDELSGRKTRLVTTKDGDVKASPIIERPKAQIVKEFVTGNTDALLLTRAGSTGISLHAGEKFPDQRQRVMIELQSAADVNVRVQFFGRVNRKGQTSSPEIETLSSGLIGEARPIAMQNAKLRKLSANTTANQDNAALDRTVPDFINGIGDKVAYRFLEANPSIARRLSIDMDNEDDREESYFINKLTSRLVMLKDAEQVQIYDALTVEYLRVIKELDAKGINPLKSREMDVRAREIEREVFEAGNPYSSSAFSHPVYVKTIEYDVQVDPIRSDAVKARIESGAESIRRHKLNTESLHHQEFFLRLKAHLATNRAKYLESALSKEFADVDEALSSSKVNSVQKMHGRLRVLDKVLDTLRVGAAARFTNNEGETEWGIIVRIEVPENPKNIHLLGGYELAFAVPGKQYLVERSLYSLQEDVQFSVMPAGGGELQLFQKFDLAKAGTMTHRRLVLDGNLFKAAQIAALNGLGSSVIYTDANGSRHRGVLLSRGVAMKDLQELPVRLESPLICSELMKRYPDTIMSTAQSGKPEEECDAILMLQDGQAVLQVPGTKSRGGRYFGDKDLIKVTGEFSGSRSCMIARFPVQNIDLAMKALYRNGISMYVKSSMRECINDLNKLVYTNESCKNDAEANRMALAV